MCCVAALLLLLAPAAAAPPRFAVCITGEPRVLTEPRVTANVDTHLLRALPGSTHLFASFPAASASDPRLAAVMRVLKAREVHFGEPPEYVEACGRTDVGLKYASSFAQQWGRLEECYSRVKAAEAVDGQPFDYFVRARPDLFYFEPQGELPPPDAVLALERVYTPCFARVEQQHPINDHYALMPRALADAYVGAAEVLSDCGWAEELAARPDCDCVCNNCVTPSPECYLTGALLRAGVATRACLPTYETEAAGRSPRSAFALIRAADDGRLMDRYFLQSMDNISRWFTRSSRVFC
jgi:hypothetical protein